MTADNVIELVTDHFQVLFGDEVQAPLADTTRLWDAPGRVASLQNGEIVGVGTIRYGGTTRLTVRIDDDPKLPAPEWQMMGSFEVHVPSGRLVFWAPESEDIDRAPRIELPPGRYQGNAFCRGEGEVRDEMASTGPDEYLILLSRLNEARNGPGGAPRVL